MSKNISHLFSNTRMLFLKRCERDFFSSLRRCEKGTVTRIFGPSGKTMEKMHNEELNDYYF